MKRLEEEVYNPSGVRPPDNMTVEFERRPVLYLPDGRVLVKRPIGFSVAKVPER